MEEKLRVKIEVDSANAKQSLQQMKSQMEGLKKAYAEYERLVAQQRVANTTGDSQQWAALEKQISKCEEALRSYGVATNNADKVSQEYNKQMRSLKSSLSEYAKETEKTKSANSGATASFGKLNISLGRMVAARLVSSAIRGIASAMREGISNVAAYSALMGDTADSTGTANGTMSQLTSTLSYLKNTIGAAVIPAITALLPVINTLADVVARVFNFINQLLSAMSGASTWTRATNNVTNYGAALSDAAGSAAALQKSLLGIDEINAMSDSSSSGGGGTSGGGTDYSSMFEQVPIDTSIAKVADALNSLIQPIKDTIAIVDGPLTAAFDLFFDTVTGQWDKLGDDWKDLEKSLYDAGLEMADQEREDGGGRLSKTLQTATEIELTWAKLKTKIQVIGKDIKIFCLEIKRDILTIIAGFVPSYKSVVDDVTNEIEAVKESKKLILSESEATEKSLEHLIDTYEYYFTHTTAEIHQDIAEQLKYTKSDYVNAFAYIKNKYKVDMEWLEDNYPEITVDSYLASEAIDAIMVEYGLAKGKLEENPAKLNIDLTKSNEALVNWVNNWDGSSLTINVIASLNDTSLQNSMRNYGWSGRYTYAAGGFPDVGSAFIAGEAGPEFVGNINGRTGVVSAGEISGIRDAVLAGASQESALLAEQNSLLRQLLAKTGSVSISSSELVRSLARENTRTGRGVVALQY